MKKVLNCIPRIAITLLLTIVITTNGGIIPPDSCTITTQQLKDIIDLINAISNTPTGVYYNVSHTAVRKEPETCNELIDEMQDNLKDLSDLFEKLRDDSISEGKYDELKAEYEEKIKDIKKQADDLLAAADKESKQQIDELNKQIQDLQAKLTEALEEIEKLREELLETKILLIISEVQAGNSASAVKRFNELEKPKLLTRVVSNAYNKDHKKTPLVLDFINGFVEGETFCLGYKELFDAMKNNGDTLAPEMILFVYNLKKAIESETSNFSWYLDNVKDAIPYVTRQMFFGFRLCIQNEEYEGNVFGDATLTDGDRRRIFAYHDYRHSQIYEWRLQYNPTDGYFNIYSDFYEYLFIPTSEITENNDRRHIFTQIGGSKPSKGADWYIELLDSTSFALKNKDRNEYVYVDPDYNWDEIRRKVFTWIPGGRKDYSAFNFDGCS